jgi:predicted AAA+ superfamily ATPase
VIDRKQYDIINKLLARFPAVALLGARQTGKTTVALEISMALKDRVLYLDLEKDSHLQRLQYDAEAYLSMNSDKLVIIDEVQRKPELFALLRALIDDNRKPGRFLLLGSSSPHLVKGVSESLAGRIAYTEIGGISIEEAYTSKITYETLWLKGGFPTPLLSDGSHLDDEWYRYFVQSYIKRDLALMFGVALSEKTVENFWKMLAGSNGALFNKEMYARSLGVTAPTVNRYLHYMDAAFLINELQPWSANTGKRLVKMPKIYIRDSGILHALNKIISIDDLFGSIHAGASWEGFVIEQL